MDFTLIKYGRNNVITYSNQIMDYFEQNGIFHTRHAINESTCYISILYLYIIHQRLYNLNK